MDRTIIYPNYDEIGQTMKALLGEHEGVHEILSESSLTFMTNVRILRDGTYHLVNYTKEWKATSPEGLQKNYRTMVKSFHESMYYVLHSFVPNPDLRDKYGQPISIIDPNQEPEEERLKKAYKYS